MSITDIPAGREPAWVRELPDVLARRGPVTVIGAAGLLNAAGHRVTGEEVALELAARPDTYKAPGGWVSVPAVADGVVLTTLLSAAACQAGVIPPGDVDLWARLASRAAIPLLTGRTGRTAELLRARCLAGEPPNPDRSPQAGSPGGSSGRPPRPAWPAPVSALAPGGLPGLAGPAGWLARFGPGRIVALRLRGGRIEAFRADGVLDDHSGARFGQRLAALVQVCLPLCQQALNGYVRAAAVGQAGELVPAVPLTEVTLALICARPGLLGQPLPPLSAVLPALGLEVRGGLVGLPGTFWDPREAARLTPREIAASVAGCCLLRRKFQGGAPGEWQQDFWALMELGPGVISRVADSAERSGIDPETLAVLAESARTARQRTVVGLLTARTAA